MRLGARFGHGDVRRHALQRRRLAPATQFVIDVTGYFL
jgi:hypothetical protein